MVNSSFMTHLPYKSLKRAWEPTNWSDNNERVLALYIQQFPMGMAIASSARVGNALGSGNVVQAISSYKVSVICTRKNWFICSAFCNMSKIWRTHARMHARTHTCIISKSKIWRTSFLPVAVSCTMGLIFGSSKSVLGYIFTTDKWVQVSWASFSRDNPFHYHFSIDDGIQLSNSEWFHPKLCPTHLIVRFSCCSAFSNSAVSGLTSQENHWAGCRNHHHMCIFAPCWRHVGESLLGEAILSGWHKATAFQYDLDCVQGLTSGILRGAGKQKIGAILNLVGYYGVGLPIGLSLMFAGKLGIVGMCHKRLQLWVHVQKSTKKKKALFSLLKVCGLESLFVFFYKQRFLLPSCGNSTGIRLLKR